MIEVWDVLQSEKELRDLFSKKEEYSPTQLDKHERFTQASSRYKNTYEPLVSQYLISHGLQVKYPENHKFAICLTHDIDDIYPPFKHLLLSSFYSIKSRNFNQLSNQLLWKLDKKRPSPYRNFKQIIEIERAYNAKSTFYFMATEHDPLRERYKIDDIQEDLRNIIESGWEIGLHVGYYSYDNPDFVMAEKKKLENILGRTIIGCRNHYLRFRVPDTWETLAKAGFKYDTTFGYSDAIGFRNGMCHPFHPININTYRQIDIMEIPLNVMDATFRDDLDLNLDINRASMQIEKMVDSVEKCNGVLTILWHNTSFNCPFLEKFADLYVHILDYCAKKGAWLTSAEEIYRYFDKK